MPCWATVQCALHHVVVVVVVDVACAFGVLRAGVAHRLYGGVCRIMKATGKLLDTMAATQRHKLQASVANAFRDIDVDDANEGKHTRAFQDEEENADTTTDPGAGAGAGAGADAGAGAGAGAGGTRVRLAPILAARSYLKARTSMLLSGHACSRRSPVHVALNTKTQSKLHQVNFTLA